MLAWFVCRFAPRLRPLLGVPTPELPEPAEQDDLRERAAAVLAALDGLVLRPEGELDPFRLIFGMGCEDLAGREADQDPTLAGGGRTWAPFGAFQPVEIPVGDGLSLPGRHSVGPPGAPVVIVVHGLFDSHASAYVVPYAEALRRMGFHVVALDMRDHGRLRGKGRVTTLGLHEGRDLLEAARVLGDAEGVSVGILGLSFGGVCAVRAAHEASKAGRPELLRGGVLTIGAPLDMQELVGAFDDPSRLPRPSSLTARLVRRGVLSTLRRHLALRVPPGTSVSRAGHDAESYVREVVLPACPDAPPLVGSFLGLVRCTQKSVLGTLGVPTAIVHSTNDPLVPVLHARRARDAAGDNPCVRVLELPEGGHVALQHVDPAYTQELLATFFGGLV